MFKLDLTEILITFEELALSDQFENLYRYFGHHADQRDRPQS